MPIVASQISDLPLVAPIVIGVCLVLIIAGLLYLVVTDESRDRGN